MGAGLLPQAKPGRIGKIDLQMRPARHAPGQRPALEIIPDQRVAFEHRMGGREAIALHRGGNGLGRDQARLRAHLADRRRLGLGEADAMRLDIAVIGQRPGEGGMIAEGEGHARLTHIGDRRRHPQRRILQHEPHVEPEVERIDGARRHIRVQPQQDAIVGLLLQREGFAPGKAMLRHRIFMRVQPIDIVPGPPDEGEEQGRVARPPARIGIGHQRASLRVPQRPEFSAQRLDLRRQAGGMDGKTAFGQKRPPWRIAPSHNSAPAACLPSCRFG